MYPIQSVVITLDKGTVVGIKFESLNKACSETAVQEPLLSMNYSFINPSSLIYNCPKTDCTGTVNNTGACDPKLYVAWVGTDTKGKYLTSANVKITNFNNYNMSKVYTDLVEDNTNNHENEESPIGYDAANLSADVKTRLANPEALTPATTTDTTTPTTTDGGATTTSGNTNNTPTSSGNASNSPTTNGNTNTTPANSGTASTSTA